MNLQALSHAQIQHNFLAAARDSVGADISVQSLDLSSLATTRVTQTAEDLTGLTGAVLEGSCRLGLEAGDSTSKLEHGFGLVHGRALVDDVLEPVVGGFDLAGHVGELHTDNGVVDELDAEGGSLAAVFDRFFVADAGEADTLDDDSNTLVVEVGHDD